MTAPSFFKTSGGGLIAFLFTWSFSPFTRLPRAQRERILQGWRDSWFSASRSLFSSLKRLVLVTYLKSPPPAIGFPLQHAVVRSAAAAAGSVLPDVHRFTFRTFPGARKIALLEADVVIVGSGAGGGVVAAKLAGLTAQGGRKLKVVVADKGECVPIEQLPVEQAEIQRVYDGPSGALMTRDGKGAILAGSTWGGGTTVNFSGSLEVRLLAPPHGWICGLTGCEGSCRPLSGKSGARSTDWSLRHPPIFSPVLIGTDSSSSPATTPYGSGWDAVY